MLEDQKQLTSEKLKDKKGKIKGILAYKQQKSVKFLDSSGQTEP